MSSGYFVLKRGCLKDNGYVKFEGIFRGYIGII